MWYCQYCPSLQTSAIKRRRAWRGWRLNDEPIRSERGTVWVQNWSGALWKHCERAFREFTLDFSIYLQCLHRKSRFTIPTSIPTRSTSTGEEFHSFNCSFHFWVDATLRNDRYNGIWLGQFLKKSLKNIRKWLKTVCLKCIFRVLSSEPRHIAWQTVWRAVKY